MSEPLVDSTEVDDFRALVAPHLIAMRWLASRLTSDPDGDRIVNLALRRAWLERSQRDQGQRDRSSGSDLTWLLAIVAASARRRPRRRERPAGSELIDVADGVIEIDVGHRMDLDADIASLPWRERLAIELFYVLDLDVAACSEVLGCSEAATVALLTAARGELLGGAQQVDLW